jgi:hypothetical protein
VTHEFWGGPLLARERAILRRSLGLSENEFLVLLTCGGEGSGGIERRARAILRWFADVDVVAVCGRNARLKRRLDRRAARSGGRLTVTGFTGHMADLLRCCDLVVTKAGPGTIAEAACCGTPMLLTSHVPGQEHGNTELVALAAAGRGLPGVRELVTEIARLRDDPAAVDAMRAASARMSRPGAAADIAAQIANLATGTRMSLPTPRTPSQSPLAPAAPAPDPSPPAANDIDGASMHKEQHQCSIDAAGEGLCRRGSGQESSTVLPPIPAAPQAAAARPGGVSRSRS